MYIHISFSSRLAIAIVICLCSAATMAQDSTFGVDSYITEKFTDFQWLIDGNIMFNGSRYEGERIFPQLEDTVEIERAIDAKRFDLTSSLYYRYETIPNFYTLNIKAMAYIHDDPGGSLYGRLDYVRPGLNAKASAGHYIWKDLFIAGSADIGWSYSHTSNDVNPERHIRSFNFEGVASTGWGRTYEGRYAATALYILDELKDNGLVVRNATHSEMMKLADIIYNYRNTKPVDKRLHKIEALNAIMRFLEDFGISKAAGPYGYLLIQDVWDFFPNYERRFGLKIEPGIGFSYSFDTRQGTDERDESRHQYFHSVRTTHDPFLQLRVVYAKPLSLRLQVDVEALWQEHFNSFEDDDSFIIQYEPDPSRIDYQVYTSFDPRYVYEIVGRFRYIVDSRTKLNLALSYDMYHRRRHSDTYKTTDTSSTNLIEDYRDERQEYMRAAAGFEYRISIPTTLMFTASYHYNYGETATGIELANAEAWRYNINLNIVHYLY